MARAGSRPPCPGRPLAASLQANCTVTLCLSRVKVAGEAPYVATVELGDVNGEKLTRLVTIRVVTQ